MTHKYCLLGAALILAGCAYTTPTPEPAGPRPVEVLAAPATFQPAFVQIAVGQTVKWRNAWNIPHTITPNEPEKPGTWAAARVLVTGDTFSHTFHTAGSYEYNCAIHAGMIGTIHVK